MAEKIHKFVLATKLIRLIRSSPQIQSAILHFEEQKKKLKTGPFKLRFNSTLEFQPLGLHDAFKLNYKPTPALIETVIILTKGEILTVFSSPKRAQI